MAGECDKECYLVFHMTGGHHRTDCAAYDPHPLKFFKTLRQEKLFVVQYTDGREEILREYPTPQQRRILEIGGPFRIVTFHSEFALPVEVALALRGQP